MPRPTVGITGAEGVLGRAICKGFPDVAWNAFQGDIRDAGAVTRWLADAGPLEALIHLAAIVPTGLVEEAPDEAHRVNVGGTVAVLEAVRRARWPVSPWLCVVSSSHVYRSSAVPLREDSVLEPISLYGVTKLQSEQWALAYMNRYGMDICIPRIFSYSSPLQEPSYVLPGMLERIRQAPRGGTLEVCGASDTRDFLSTADIVSALDALWRGRARGVYNVGSGDGVRISDVARRLCELCGRSDIQLELHEGATPIHLVAEIGRLRALGWQPGSGWKDVVAELVSPGA
jgi:nucleoside-diphosphate-sugar epimerase